MAQMFIPGQNVFDAVDAVVKEGYAAIEGTKTMAVPYCAQVIAALAPHVAISPVTSYQNVQNRGYLYLVVDTARYPPSDVNLRELVDALDRDDPG